MPKVIVVTGLQGSGKTHFAGGWLAEDPGCWCGNEPSRIRINYDELRLEMFGPTWKWNRLDEDKMKDRAFYLAEDALKDGKDVIIDNTNLTHGARKPWKSLASVMKATYEEIDLDTPVATCVARDRLREGNARVGRALIEHNALHYGYIDWSDRSVYPRDFIIVDMDGTIADCDWRRKLALQGPTVHKIIKHGANTGKPEELHCSLASTVLDRQCPECGGKAKKDWKLFMSNVEKDPPIWPIIDLVAMLSHIYDPIVVSGRPMDVCGMGTEEWLNNTIERDGLGWPIKHLFMRNRGDYRDDVIVKQEILDLLPKDRIKYVLDDRDGVVQMWRKNGLTCLQVANGNF